MGYAVDGTTAVIVNDQMEWGSLADRLSVFTGRAALSWRARVGVARDAARGLLFLHRALSVPISHGLVHCGSVFLTANAEARLGDFSRASLLASASSNGSCCSCYYFFVFAFFFRFLVSLSCLFAPFCGVRYATRKPTR